MLIHMPSICLFRIMFELRIVLGEIFIGFNFGWLIMSWIIIIIIIRKVLQ